MELRRAKIEYLDIHHTAGYEANTEAVRQEHLNIGYGDIGYQAVIEPNGTVGKGRDLVYAGAHDPGIPKDGTVSMNQCAYGISHIGNFNEHTMSEAQFQASVAHAVEKCREFGIPVSKIRRHKDQYPTECPGSLFPWARYLAEIQKRLEGNKVKDLVVYFGEGDIGAAFLLRDKLRCPMIPKEYVTPRLLASVYTVHLVGGPNDIPGVKYYSGQDRFETAKKVLE